MSVSQSLAFATGVGLTTWAKGIIIRRKAMVALAERLGTDALAVRQMQKLRARHHGAPLRIRNPIRPQIVLFREEDVRRVLMGAPELFSPASQEKRAALSHFEPRVSLITAGPARAPRRAFHDEVLDSACPVHRLGEAFVSIVDEEAGELMRHAAALGELNWPLFFESWFRCVRRIVLGTAARDDRDLTDRIARLRSRANWAFAAPKNRSLRAAFHRRLAGYLEEPEPGSLAALVADLPGAAKAEPTQQMAQWLFAFDPAGMTTFRALALLVAHPRALEKARAEIASIAIATDRPFLRAAIVETLRLYPTTPMVLRQTTRETEWTEGRLPAGTGILIFAPFFHRDDERMANAHRFEPEAWLGKDPTDALPLIPFSAGPGACPAHHLVPMLASAMVARILEGDRRLELYRRERLDPSRPLPATLDPYALRFLMTAGP